MAVSVGARRPRAPHLPAPLLDVVEDEVHALQVHPLLRLQAAVGQDPAGDLHAALAHVQRHTAMRWVTPLTDNVHCFLQPADKVSAPVHEPQQRRARSHAADPHAEGLRAALHEQAWAGGVHDHRGQRVLERPHCSHGRLRNAHVIVVLLLPLVRRVGRAAGRTDTAYSGRLWEFADPHHEPRLPVQMVEAEPEDLCPYVVVVAVAHVDLHGFRHLSAAQHRREELLEELCFILLVRNDVYEPGVVEVVAGTP
mmetsp:Transcript_91387/g.242734  ORF Transcript_91387/g.242734 Transcript_91387/m.242734 type:complete len:253 (+) Transcript_91387:65-823(+)